MKALNIIFLFLFLAFSATSQTVDQLIGQLEKELLPEKQDQVLFSEYEPIVGLTEYMQEQKKENEFKLATEIYIPSQKYISAVHPDFEKAKALLSQLYQENPKDHYDRLLKIYIQYEERYLRDWFPFYINNQQLQTWIMDYTARDDAQLNKQGEQMPFYQHFYIAMKFDGLLHSLYAQMEYNDPEELYHYYKSAYINYFSNEKLGGEEEEKEIVQGYFVSNRLRYYFKQLDEDPFLSIIEPVAHQLQAPLIKDLLQANWTSKEDLKQSGEERPVEEQFVLYNLRQGYYDDIENEQIRDYCKSSYKQWVRAGLEHEFAYWIIDMEDKGLIRFFIRKFLDYEAFMALRKDMSEIERTYLTLGMYNFNESVAQPILKEELFSRVWKDCQNGDFHNIRMLSLFPSDEVVTRLIELPDQYKMTREELQFRNNTLDNILFNFEQDRKSEFRPDDALSEEVYQRLKVAAQN